MTTPVCLPPPSSPPSFLDERPEHPTLLAYRQTEAGILGLAHALVANAVAEAATQLYSSSSSHTKYPPHSAIDRRQG
jgi:hypothetical protein